MIQHTKSSVFIYLFIQLFISCNGNGQDKKEGVWYFTKSRQFVLDPKNEIETLFDYKDQYIVLRNDSIFYAIGDTITPACLVNGDLIKESLDFNINGGDDDRKRIKMFLKDTLNLDEKKFKGLYKLDCDPPMNKLFDFGDKFLIREYGVYYHVFEKTKPLTQKTKDVKVEIENLETYILPIDYDKSKSLTFTPIKGVFSEIDMENLSLLKLPMIYDLNPILIRGHHPRGDEQYCLAIFNNQMQMLDYMRIMYFEETEQEDDFGVLLTSFSINKDYQLTIKKEKSLKNRNLIEKVRYKVMNEGKFKKLDNDF